MAFPAILALAMAAGAAGALAQSALEPLFPPLPDNGQLSETARGTRSLAEHADTFIDPVEAVSVLTAWGWQENAYQYLEGTGDGGDEAPYLYISLTRFADEAGATAALPYIVADLSAGEGHREVPLTSSIGDDAYALAAPGEEGTDYTLYVRSDALILRVSAPLGQRVSSADPERVAAQIIANQYAPPVPTPAPISLLDALLDPLPVDLPACLRVVGEEVYDFPGVVARFSTSPTASADLRGLGWEAGSYRQFSCGVSPVEGLNWVDMSVHEFSTPEGAASAVPYFAHARTVGTQLLEVDALLIGDRSAAISGPSELGTEYTLYVSRGSRLIRVTAITLNGDPRPDAELLMVALILRNVPDQGAGITGGGMTGMLGHNGAVREEGPFQGPNGVFVRIWYDDGTFREIPFPEPAMGIAAAASTSDGRTNASEPPAASEAITGAGAPDPAQPSPSCDPSYPDVCIAPVSLTGDLDCQDIPHRRFRVVGNDPHRFDGPYDGSNPTEPDGIGCERD